MIFNHRTEAIVHLLSDQPGLRLKTCSILMEGVDRKARKETAVELCHEDKINTRGGVQSFRESGESKTIK